MDPTDPNPYAAPGEDGPAPAKKKRRNRYSARLDGPNLVLVRDHEAELPKICLKCGSHDGILERHVKLQWTPVWARFLVFCCIGLIIMLVTTRRAELNVPLCVPCNARWNAARNATFASVAVLVGTFLWVRVAVTADDSRPLALALMALVFSAFIGVLVAFVRPRTLRAVRIEETEIALGGVAPGAAKEIVEGSA